jgi:1-acyl-sn-glycerol-3-phosphate acyltransferase
MSVFFKYVFVLLWKCWFFVVFGCYLLLFSPFLLVVTARQSWYGVFFKGIRIWASLILWTSGLGVKKEEAIPFDLSKNYMFIANHTSILDILLMLVITKNPFVFVGKKELGKIPLFGFFYKRTCILVDRSSVKSKASAFRVAQNRINSGLSICIFPEGLVPDDSSVILSAFKGGAFHLAVAHQLTLVPMTFLDCKKRLPYILLKGGPGVLRVRMHPFIETTDMNASSAAALKQQCYDLLYSDLISG